MTVEPSSPRSAPWPTRRAAWLFAFTVLLGVATRPYALDLGPAADDFAQLGMLEGHYPVPRSPFDLFNFTNGTRADLAVLVQSGFFPWWSHPDLRLSMWRPLSSALMWLDLHAFGDHYMLYHLHSLAWWAAFAVAVGMLWRRLLPWHVGALALVLFALDEAHGVLIAWIANRNASTSALFGVLALVAYVGAREGRARHGAWLSALSFAVALGFGEYALTLLGYFAAYELLARPEPAHVRLRALWPIAVPTAAFLVLRAVLGFGPRHSGIYVDPFLEPLAFVTALIERVPIFVADLTFALRADYWTFGMPWIHELYQRGLVDAGWITSLTPWRNTQWAIGGLALLAYGAIAWSVLRHRPKRDPLAWLALGGAIALLPAVSPFPSSRLLAAALIGFCPIFATFIVEGLGAPRRVGRTLVCASFAALQLSLPAWHTFTETRNVRGIGRAIRTAVHTMEVDDAKLPQQRVIIMNAVDAGLGFYVPLIRMREGLSAPERCWVVSGSPMPMHLTRISPSSFVVELVAGQGGAASPYEQMFRSSREPLRVGEKIDLDGMRVQVLAVRNGGFTRARFELDRSLDDPSLVFMQAGLNGLRRFGMPEIGSRVFVPGPMPATLMRHSRRALLGEHAANQ